MSGQTLEKATKRCPVFSMARVLSNPRPERQMMWQLPEPETSEESSQPSVTPQAESQAVNTLTSPSSLFPMSPQYLPLAEPNWKAEGKGTHQLLSTKVSLKHLSRRQRVRSGSGGAAEDILLYPFCSSTSILIIYLVKNKSVSLLQMANKSLAITLVQSQTIIPLKV